MLYIPLKADEKFRARAVIDVFAHRSSKAFSSVLIIGVTAFFSNHLLTSFEHRHCNPLDL